jgi:hypothetical protein
MNKLLNLAISRKGKYADKHVVDMYDKYLPLFEKVCKNNLDSIVWVNGYDEFYEPDEVESFLLDTLMETAVNLGYFPHCDDSFFIEGDEVDYHYCEDEEEEPIELVKEDLQKFKELTGINIEVVVI